jgi:hypothetical protein
VTGRGANPAAVQRHERITARFHADAAAAEVWRAERVVEHVRQGRGDLECAIAELRRARLALADAHHVIESVEAP